jgi:hypothetical protein
MTISGLILAKDNSEFNSSYEDFGDQSSYLWTERNGRKYLAGVGESIGRFYELYIQTRHISNHMDLIFTKMKWLKLPSDAQKLGFHEDGNNVITFHRSPLYIAFSAILAFIENIFNVATQRNVSLPLVEYFDVCKSLNLISRELMCGIFSLDSTDYALATCHFKNVIRASNAILFTCNILLASTDGENNSGLLDLLTDLRIATFDIHELSWQATMLCDSTSE